MSCKLEKTIKLLSILAPVVFFILPASAIDSGSPLAFLVFAFPYFVIFVFTQFVKQKSCILLTVIAVLLALLIISSAVMLFSTGSDPQSAVGISIIYIAQALVAGLFVSIYFVIRAFSSSVHNKPGSRDTNA